MIILTEKPSVAAAFAAALCVPRKGKFFENSDFCIVNAIGHLLENYAPEDYDPALKKWALDGLPIIPDKFLYRVIENTKDQLDVVTACLAAHKNDELLLATDAEREGELIGAEILDYAGFTNLSGAKRFWVSEALTPEVIRKGIENAKPLSAYASYREQGYARQHADWLIGMNLTRLISLKSGKLLTFGRVQTAILTAVHEREKSIAAFTSEKFFEVKALLDNGHPFSVRLVNKNNEEFPTRFPEHNPALSEIDAKKQSLKSGTITKMITEKKTVHPPKLFNLTALQKEAHKKFSYAPEETLTIAQALYEKHKCLSYPRTPSRVMGDDNVDLVKGIFEKLKGLLPDLSAGTDDTLVAAGNKRVFNSADLVDHHALIPLAPVPGEASSQEKNVFSLVLKQFFTVFMPDFVYNAIKIDVDISGFLFQGTGRETLQPGWKNADYEREDEEGEEEQEDYSGLAEGESYQVSSIATEEKYTEPKKHHTYASLLALMENPRNEDGKRLTGLGTPATRGSILKKLFDRGYLVQKGKTILISNDGEFLVANILKNEALGKFVSIPETTRWEEELHANTHTFLYGIKNFIRNVVENTSIDTYQAERTSLGKCPLCEGDIYEGKKGCYCSNYKSDPPCRFTIWKEIAGASVSPADVQALLAGKQTKVKKCKSKAGKEFQAAFKLEAGEVKFIFDNEKTAGKK
jgi:DNA topoisomerase-3